MRLPGHREIGKSTWANWRTSFVIGACLLLGGNGGVTILRTIYRLRFGGADRGDRSDLHRAVGVGAREWRVGPTPIMWMGLCRRFLLGVGILFGPGLHFHSVGGRNPAIGISILLVTSFILVRRARFTRAPAKHAASPFLTAAQQMICGGMLLLLAGRSSPANCHGFIPSPFPCCRSAHLFISSSIGRCGRLHGLHLAAASLRTGRKSPLTRYVNPIVAVLLGTFFAGENRDRTHADCRCSHHRFSGN